MRLPVAPTHGAGRINVTPMIDVVMCLIVFYLIVGHLAAERRTMVRVPAAIENSPENEEPTRVVVTVRADGSIDADGEASSIEDLARRLAIGPAGGTDVLVRADRDLPYRDVGPVLDVCRSAGVRVVNLATERRP